MANETALIPEYIFVTYDGIIKNYRPTLIQLILKEYKEEYKTFINTPFLETLDYEHLMGLAIQSTSPNIFEYLSTREFEYDNTLDIVYNRYKNLFTDSPLLSMGTSLHILLKQSFVKKIYIYTDIYDKRIHFDIQSNFEDMDKIEYINGPFFDVMNSISEHITSYILNDISYVDMLIDLGIIGYSNVLLANYGYNYKITNNDKRHVILKIDDIEQKSKDLNFKFVTFNVSNNYEIVTNYRSENN